MSNVDSEYSVGQRLSLKGQLCTVQYFGPVGDKSGTWLGVEWDDPDRGKHNGTHEGALYFKCLYEIQVHVDQLVANSERRSFKVAKVCIFSASKSTMGCSTAVP